MALRCMSVRCFPRSLANWVCIHTCRGHCRQHSLQRVCAIAHTGLSIVARAVFTRLDVQSFPNLYSYSRGWKLVGAIAVVGGGRRAARYGLQGCMNLIVVRWPVILDFDKEYLPDNIVSL